MTERLAEKKIRGRRGFSLAELLVALLITSLAGLVVMGGIGVTTRLFQDVLLHSQAQLVMKEYMSELRAGFLSAETESAVQIVEYNANNPEDTADPVFTHSGYSCAGYYMLVPASGDTLYTFAGDTAEYGVIVFQPAIWNYANGTVHKTPDNGETLPPAMQLINAHLSDSFLAAMTYRYQNGEFTGTLTVKSLGLLSTGENVEISTVFSFTPAGG